MMRKVMLLAMFVCWALAPLAMAQDTGASTVTAARKRAKEARGLDGSEREAVLADALKIFGQVAERFPKDTRALATAALESARIHRRLGNRKQAIECFEKVREYPKEEILVCKSLLDLSSMHRTSRDYPAAEAAVEDLIQNYTSQPRYHALALMKLASLKRFRRDWAGAEAKLVQCLELHGGLWRQSVDALDDLVSLKLARKDVAGAREALDRELAKLRATHQEESTLERLEGAVARMPAKARLEKVERMDGNK